MDWIEGKKKITEVFQKYKFAGLIVLIGIVLMLLPVDKTRETESEVSTPTYATQPALSVQLTEILGQIKGAGRVAVVLTESCGMQYVYQTNDDFTEDTDRTDRRTDTVLITDSQRNQAGLIQTTIPPQYLGAIVVCDGADDPNVKLAVVDAVSKATGLGSDKISVLKMK